MKIQRTLPPTAAPMGWSDLWHGVVTWVSRGDELKRREEEFRKYFGVKHVFFVSSGKAALYLILRGLKVINPGKDQVIIPAYTCFSVPSAIVKAGLKVTPCDIDSGTFDFNRAQLGKVISDRTLCVIPGHLFGVPSDVEFSKRVCKPRGIVVVEDAAQAMGGTYRGLKLGTVGDVGFFSFGRGKNITCGDGGVILTDSEAIAEVIGKEYVKAPLPALCEGMIEFLKLVLLVILIQPRLYWLPAALPFLRLGETIFYKDFPVQKLSRFKAGILRGWQQRLEHSNKLRKENARSICYGSNVKPAVESWENIVFLRLPLLLKDKEGRDRLYRVGWEAGAGFSRMYPAPVSEINEIKDQMKHMDFPEAKGVADRLVNIPTHHLLSKSDRERICRMLSTSDCCSVEGV